MSSDSESKHIAEGEGSGSGRLAARRRSSPSPSTIGRAAQGINDNKFSGNSRTHIGNVYHYIASADVDQSDSFAVREMHLMAALAFKGMSDRLFTVSPACANTCAWFLKIEEYVKWRDTACRSSHHGILWIKGKVGTGKSTLMRYIHDHAHKASQHVPRIAFFFNGRSREKLVKSSEGMYRSLLHQLYSNFSRLRLAAAQRISATKPHTWSVKILEDLFREAVLGLAVGEEVTCYIDALDECPNDQARLVIEYFEDLMQSVTTEQVPFSVCLSSRHYPQITIRNHVELELDSLTQHLGDISKYLDSRLTMPSAMKLELSKEIEVRCSGIFLWVVLVVRMLKESFDKGADWPELYSLLTSLPQELNALFTIIARSPDAGFAVAMRWVLLSEWPLKSQELYFAIRMELQDLTSGYWSRTKASAESIQSYILHVSRGLFECTKLSVVSPYSRPGETQFVHESVREFLLSGSLADMFSVSQHNLLSVSHAAMAMVCQQYLKFCIHGRPNIVNMERNNDPGDHDDCFPLAHYALTNVFIHLQVAYTSGLPNINLLDFPMGHYTAVRQSLQRLSPGSPYYVPQHAERLLTALIECECFELAEYYLQIDPSGKSIEGHVERCETCIAAPTLSDLDPMPSDQGLWGSPLQAAVAQGNVRLVRILLEQGARVSPSSKSHLSHVREDFLLTRAPVSAIDEPTLHQRQDTNANANLVQSTTARYWARSNALHLAMRECGGPRYTDVLRALLEAGANANAVDASGETPLIRATSKASISAAKLLLDYGANAEYRSTRYGTAVETANPKILKSLLSAIRLRALKGRDYFLPLAPRPNLEDNRKISRIAKPIQTRSLRAISRLQYRCPPQSRWPLHHDVEHGSSDSMILGSELDRVDGARIDRNPEWWAESLSRWRHNVAPWLQKSHTWSPLTTNTGFAGAQLPDLEGSDLNTSFLRV